MARGLDKLREDWQKSAYHLREDFFSEENSSQSNEESRLAERKILAGVSKAALESAEEETPSKATSEAPVEAAAVAAATEQAPQQAAKDDPNSTPEKEPIKLKDAVGRKLSFPFRLCETWKGMEELIRQAFPHLEVIGNRMMGGNYALIGPDGKIISPENWESVIQPGWSITMHMLPIPEGPKVPLTTQSMKVRAADVDLNGSTKRSEAENMLAKTNPYR